MSPGAVAAILYARCRLAEPTFLLESEELPGGCYALTASWWNGCGRTFSSILALGLPQEIGAMCASALRSLDRRARRSGS